MAKIWPLSAAGGHAPPPSWGEMEISLPEAIRLLELRHQDLESGMAAGPGLAEQAADLWPVEARQMMVEVGRHEGEQAGWRPGLYKSRIVLREARERLIQHALVSELGADNVIRVALQPTTDFEGRDALKVTIVIAPGATQRLEHRVLDALVALRRCLHAMGEERFPIAEYATEAELAEDGDPQS